MSDAAERQFDLIVFGAYGCSAQYVIEELCSVSSSEGVQWAIAGRNERKLTNLLQNLSSVSGETCMDVKTIVADTKDYESLKSMCQQTKLLLNCVGPYRFTGEQVVRACIETKTHYVDISGEPYFLEKIQLQYHEEAKKAHCYVIGSCGYDCIPSEIGLQYLQKNFNGHLEAVEMLMIPNTDKSKPLGIHYGTWQSAIYGLANAKDLKQIRKLLMPDRLPKSNYSLSKRKPFRRYDDVNGYCFTTVTADKSVLTRTQYYFLKTQEKSPVSTEIYIVMPNFFEAIKYLFTGVIFVLFCQFVFGRYLLKKFPDVFSLGYVFPSKRSKDVNSKFMVLFHGFGYKDKTEKQNHRSNSMQMTLKMISSAEPYKFTGIAMVQCALVILKEIDQLPDKGGVYTTASAFSSTQIIKRLCNRGLQLSIIKRN